MSSERDDTTRYLCAAAHLDDRFADRVIREYLTEPTRAVPPTAGVRAGAVLAEAVAARARRKLRDTALVVLVCAAVFLLPIEVLLAWVLIGVAVAVGVTAIGAPDRGKVVTNKAILPALGIALVGAVVFVVLQETGGSSSPSGYPGYPPEATTGDDVATTVLGISALALILAVLIADEFVVWRHLRHRFRRGQPIADPGPDDLTAQARPVYSLGTGNFLTQLRRHLHGPAEWLAHPQEPRNGDDAPAPVLVARGYHMFVGAGEPHEPWSLAVPLRPVPDAEQVVRLTPEVLYRRIDRAMDSLREAAHLSPGGRFRGLRVTEHVVVAAEELIDHPEPARDFLAGRAASPYPLLRGQRVRELRDDPLEWARYYLRFQVETWDRDFVVSAFLHLAVSDTTLYVEWTPCVLLPVNRRYRTIDDLSDSPLPPVGRALTKLLSLPATLPQRLYALARVIRPKQRRPGTLSPDMYGVEYSLRELAADREVHNYFQLADRDRYLKMLESRLTLALVDVLREAGYSVATLEQQVATVANNNVYITNGSFTGNMVTGKGNSAGPVSTGAAPAAGSGTAAGSGAT